MDKPNRNLFRITRFILLRGPFLLRFLVRFRKPGNKLLLIKTDAIGDYILFRNYIEIVRRSARFKDYHITFLGNELWKEITEKYDVGFVDELLFIDPESLYHSPLKTLKLGWRLFKGSYQVVLQPAYTRLLVTDGLAGLTAAKQIIGFESDNEGLPARYKAKTDKFYSERLTLQPSNLFEFYRSKFFFESVLNCNIQLEQPHLPIDKKLNTGIVIFPGAGIFKRGWEAGKFLALIKLTLEHTTQPVYLAGGAGEIPAGLYLEENLPPGSVTNLTGKTSLLELIDLIGNAALVISNETSAIHIAAATKTKAVCILGGGHFGRFSPYPRDMENAPVCVFEKMPCYHCNWNCIYKTAENEPFPCVSAIALDDVWQVVKGYLEP